MTVGGDERAKRASANLKSLLEGAAGSPHHRPLRAAGAHPVEHPLAFSVAFRRSLAPSVLPTPPSVYRATRSGLSSPSRSPRRSPSPAGSAPAAILSQCRIFFATAH